MRRREFIATAVTALTVLPLVARAQQSIPVIGFLGSATAAEASYLVDGFRQGLRDAGRVEGRDVAIAFRWADNDHRRLPALAADLVRQKVAIIVGCGGAVASLAAKSATATIPIVFAIGADPVKVGLVSSLSRPGGNVTGVSFLASQLTAKRVELFHEMVPRAAEIAVLYNPNNPESGRISQEIEAAQSALRLRLPVFPAGTEREIEAAFTDMMRRHVDGLMIGGDTFFNAKRREIISLAAHDRLPSMFDFREFAAEGGLASYGANIKDAYRRAGVYAAKILGGAAPGALPVEQPTKFELVVNLKIAKALGIAIPQSILLRAEEVIE